MPGISAALYRQDGKGLLTNIWHKFRRVDHCVD